MIYVHDEVEGEFLWENLCVEATLCNDTKYLVEIRWKGGNVKKEMFPNLKMPTGVEVIGKYDGTQFEAKIKKKYLESFFKCKKRVKIKFDSKNKKKFDINDYPEILPSKILEIDNAWISKYLENNNGDFLSLITYLNSIKFIYLK